MKTTYFTRIPAVPKKDMILVRLGYKKTMTVLDEKDNAFLENAIQEGLLLCKPQGIMGCCRITNRSKEFIELEEGDRIYSGSLAGLLGKSDEVLLMAATVGSEIVDRIHHELNRGEASFGVIMDSVASQTADASVAWIMDFADKIMRRDGKRMAKQRYSPGYGDLLLSNQKLIFDLLKLEKLGLSLTEKYMLVPEKSVIAIAGIEKVGMDE